MKVFKFGGASVKDSYAVRNLAKILNNYKDEDIVVVISAMDKITNALEDLLDSKMLKHENVEKKADQITAFHQEIINDLFPSDHPIHKEIGGLLSDLRTLASRKPDFHYDREYDQLVSFGEILSTRIIHEYLLQENITSTWLDARNVIKTDNTWRAARVDMMQSEYLISSVWESKGNRRQQLITQGFIGSDDRKRTTTLGREGSDFTAAVFAYALQAEEVVTWKDVPGLFNADPKRFERARQIKHISFRETIELSYYGAKIIHPNTIKPLQNKNIPLKVKSFLNPEDEGSVINHDTSYDGNMESYIIKSNQVLISMLSRDYEFITENSLSFIFAKFASYNMKINLMQNSAITFTACVDRDDEKIASLILDLRDRYHIRYNEELELLTIRNFNENIIGQLTKNKEILVEQRSRTTVQFVMKPEGIAE
ncbi:MAG: aspartate kinase [Bacteroidales bacterium]|nr:aspartate kinase [Bacteroidales bacterium]